MMKTNWKSVESYFLLIGAVITWSALLLQFYLIIENRTASVPETIVRFFSYFTILSNTLAAICFTVLKRGRKSKLYPFISQGGVVTAVSVYILIVGLIYQIILRATWSPEGLQLIVDELLHSVVPLYFLIYWIAFASKERLQWKSILSWLLFPLLYLIFIMIRGVFSGFYPYPFIDVTELSYIDVLVNSGLLLALFVLFSACYISVGMYIQKHKFIDF